MVKGFQVSGSAALSEYVMKKWHQISGHWLLERYGMTKVGMALTNPLNGERIPGKWLSGFVRICYEEVAPDKWPLAPGEIWNDRGTVGKPFPSVKVKIGQTDVYTEHKYTTLCEGDGDGTEVTPGVKEVVGELLIKGPAVFSGYWNKQEASQKTFTSDGWFKTGDTAEYKDGVYSILGRTSVDIIKSGGYKISALDIERTLISHPSIADCAVVGLPDLVWGQKVAAAVVASDSSNKTLTAKEIRSWAKDKMANYKIPSVVKVMDQIPRNAMGKVNKKELVAKEFSKYLY
ncbi:hypothetical protein FSP39_015987 [Pinctada imbricata]|uniref:Uncharacterized protein n=1 Tax=Pinctada imbricata TaxID=66713 RepID=A0AA89BM50_PINIB|nr:hypothetical protein FSP39_015987 [Pinctada imbricata]